MFEDKTLICKDCGNESHSQQENRILCRKGSQNSPARCKDCRMARKNASGRNGQRREVVMYDTVCADCGKETQVPFKPTNARPVYCKECFDAKRQ